MGKSWKNEEVSPAWNRGEDKRVLRSFAELRHTGLQQQAAMAPEDESGSQNTRPLEEKTDPVTETTITKESFFDPDDYQRYKEKSFGYINASKTALAPDVKLLSEDEKIAYDQLLKTITDLESKDPISSDEAIALMDQLDQIRGKLFGLEQRVDTIKDMSFDRSGYDIYLNRARGYFDEDKAAIKKRWNFLNEDQQKTYLEMISEIESLSDAKPSSAEEEEQLRHRIDKALRVFGELKGRLREVAPKTGMVDISEFSKNEAETKKTPEINNAMNPTGTEKITESVPKTMIENQTITPNPENAPEVNVSYSLGGKEVDLSGSVIPSDLKVESSAERSELLPGELTLEEQLAKAQRVIDQQLIDRGLKSDSDPVESSAISMPATESPTTNAPAALKLRQDNPAMSEEAIQTELDRRHQSFKELLRYRKELALEFGASRKAKTEYEESYKEQLGSRYKEYQATGWLGKMMGFNPKNLNLYGTRSRLKYAETRNAYREKLEMVFNEQLGKVDDLEQIFISQDRIRSGLTERFLLKPMRETLRLQNEVFPEADRRNIISKFKNAIKANPKVAMAIGLTSVAGVAVSTAATGGLAAMVPLAFSMGGAMGGSALAAALSTRFGVNKSERALEAALKNTELGVTSEELVAAEVKLLSAAQDVEISKNRRDVYTTAGGIAGGAAGGLMSEMLLGDLYAPDLPGDVDAPAPDQSGPEVVPPQEPEVAPDIPNDLPENNLPSEADPQPAPDVDQYDSDEGMTGDEDGEDPMETPPAPNLGSYTVEPGDNFWDIMEGQTSAKSLPTAEWMKVNQPENYQALIDLVRDVGNSDAGIREALGFGATMDDLQIGSQVDLDLLDYFARTIAENKGWIDHPEFDFTAITPEAESFIESRVKEIMI